MVFHWGIKTVFACIYIIFPVAPFVKSQSTFVCEGGTTRSYTASNTTSNFIQSRHYPRDSYDSIGDCSILITTFPSYIIKLTIQDFIKKTGKDTLKVYDGISSSDKILLNRTSIQEGGSYQSTGSVLNIRHRGTGGKNNVFKISYRAISEFPSCASDFKKYFTVANGHASIYSHSGYNRTNYDNDYDKYWLIVKPLATDELVYYFEDFKAEHDTNGCKRYDRLIVYDGPCTTDNIYARYCTINSSKFTHTGGKYLLFRMVTDGTVTDKGFHMKYYITKKAVDDDDDRNRKEDHHDDNYAWIAGPVIGGFILLSCFCNKKKNNGNAPKRAAPPAAAVNNNQPVTHQDTTETADRESNGHNNVAENSGAASNVVEEAPSNSNSSNQSVRGENDISIQNHTIHISESTVFDDPPSYFEALKFPVNSDD